MNQDNLDSLKKNLPVGKFLELMKKYKFYIIGALAILLIVRACGGGLPEAHQKYVGEWEFVRTTDDNDGFFWSAKDIKVLTLDGNGTWNLDGDKAYGDWGMDDEGMEKLWARYEQNKERGVAEQYGWTEEELKEFSFFEPKLYFRENNWNCNHAKRIVDMYGEIERNFSTKKENLVLRIEFRFFGDRLVDDGSGAEIEFDALQTATHKFYFERRL